MKRRLEPVRRIGEVRWDECVKIIKFTFSDYFLYVFTKHIILPCP